MAITDHFLTEHSFTIPLLKDSFCKVLFNGVQEKKAEVTP